MSASGGGAGKDRSVDEKTLGVLIHGAGWVSTQHIAAFQKNPHAEIVGISSRSLGSAEKRAAEAGLDVPLFDDFEKALAQPGVDIVAVCTPQHVHAENVITAAAAGKHIVIEKPVCQTLEELHAMQDAVRKAGVKTVVSFVLRWNPLFQTLKRMSADSTFGDIYYVETDYQSYSGDWCDGFSVARTREMGRSTFLIAGCHAVDAMRWFASPEEFGAADPVEVFAYQGGKRGQTTHQFNPYTNDWHEGEAFEMPGLEVAMVKFADGAIGKVSSNFECIQPYSFPIEIFGTKGTVKDNRVWSPDKYPGQKEWMEIPTICPDSSDVSHHPFQGELDHFTECILAGRESHCNLDDAVKTHEIIFAAFESYASKKPVQLPLRRT